MKNGAILESPKFLEPVELADAIGKGLEGIVKDSFGVPVSDDYVPYLFQNSAKVYFMQEASSGIVGAAVVIENPEEGMPPHLVTLAVPELYQKQGVGKEIMAELLEYYPKLNWRSKPGRKAARRLYKNITQDMTFFTAADGISYNGYFVNHTLREKNIAMLYMMDQPKHFKD